MQYLLFPKGLQNQYFELLKLEAIQFLKNAGTSGTEYSLAISIYTNPVGLQS